MKPIDFKLGRCPHAKEVDMYCYSAPDNTLHGWVCELKGPPYDSANTPCNTHNYSYCPARLGKKAGSPHNDYDAVLD